MKKKKQFTYQSDDDQHQRNDDDGNEGHLAGVLLDHARVDDRTVRTISHRRYYKYPFIKRAGAQCKIEWSKKGE